MLGGMIETWDKEGRKNAGKDIQIRKNMFEIREETSNARRWIDLRELNTWDYKKIELDNKIEKSP